MTNFKTFGGVAVATAFLLSGAQAALAMDGVAPPPTPLNSYVPKYAVLGNLNAPTGGKVCVLGYTMQKTGLKVDTTVFDIPAYYLGFPAGDHAHPAWLPATGNTSGVIPALEVGVDIVNMPLEASTQSSPSGRYLNAGNLTFFVVNAPPPGFKCSAISLTYKNKTTGDVDTPQFPYPHGLAEISTYPVWNAAAKRYSDFLTIDISNVDSFEIPLVVNLMNNTASSQRRVAFFGNPIYSPLITRRSMISGPANAGGATSPFAAWLTIQPKYASVAAPFAKLALASASYPYAFLQSPNDYLLNKCLVVPNGVNVPRSCSLNGQLINWNDPLNAYFDASLTKFFSDAFYNNGASKLSVMGDASGAFAAVPWTVQGYTACPVYLGRDARSLDFKATAYATRIVLCNPIGQVTTFKGSIAAKDYKQTPVGKGLKQTATIALPADRCLEARKYVGRNFGQPSTGWVGYITRVDCGAATVMTLDVLDAPGTFAGGKPVQKVCISTGVVNGANNCPRVNPSFPEWVYSNIAWIGGAKWWETATQMVFGNDGAFNSWQPSVYSGDTLTVAQSIARNIVAAFTRGMANCNNVTMSVAALKPDYCAKMTALKATEILPAAVKASDAYWSNQRNFYPAGGYQNYYAQYLHTQQVGAAPKASIFAPPQPIISDVALSNQNLPMGMAYGFGFDETPGYLTLQPAKIAAVPSKLDPIPASWWPANAVTSVQIVVGRAQ